MLNALNPAALFAGSACPCAVTLRVRRRAPKPLSPQLTHCRARWARPTSIGNDSFLGAGLFRCRDFASAEATRGLCGRPLDCFAHTPMFLDFYCCRGNRACGRDQRAFRSPFGNLRRRHFWGCLQLGSCCCKRIPRLRVQIRRTNPPPFKKPPRFCAAVFFVIHKDSTFLALIPHPCPRMLPAPSLPPPLRRRGGRSTS